MNFPEVNAESSEGLPEWVQSSDTKTSSALYTSELEIQQQAHFSSKNYFSAEITMEMQEYAVLPKPKASLANGSKPAWTSQPTHAPGKQTQFTNSPALKM